jgi:3-dehydroquinate synthetase
VSEVTTGRGLISDPSELLPSRDGRARVAVIHQPSTAAIVAVIADGIGDAGFEVSRHAVPDREEAKTLGVVEELAHRLNEAGLNRHDTIIGVGGGALTDVAGFLGAVYLRGIETIQVPTSLLAAVDAAVGGKTAVNVDGKNLMGVFRLPARVVIDVDTLDQLPEPLVREGAAEALKAGLIADEELVELYEHDGLAAPLDEVVERAVAVKVAVVNDDFDESGKRAILNYGHTVGHAVEVAGGLSHGDAVAVGMVAAGAASQRVVGFADADRQREIISALGLPVAVSNLDRERVLELMFLDKKRTAAGLNMVLLEAVAAPTVRTVDDATVHEALVAVGIE